VLGTLTFKAFKRFRTALLGSVFFFFITCRAFAQEAEAAGGDEKSYFLAYCLVFLVIGLGLVAICRPSYRELRPRMLQQDLKEKIRQMSGKSS